LWWNWDEVRSRPGISSLVERIFVEPLPSCGNGSFCVAVMHFENDDHRNYEDLVVAGLAPLEGITVLRFDRTISLRGARPQDVITTGNRRAREYLERSAAHLAIWGHVQHRDNKGVPLLYWTTNESTGLPRAYGYYDPNGVILPAIFWTDFSDVLQLLVMHQYAEFEEQRGRYIAQRLKPFIERVRALLANNTQLDGKAKYQTHMVIANALEIHGEQSGQNELLQDAISQFQQAAGERPRPTAPL